ncbi:PTS sugar transporter subunit IIA [Amedibacillus sp. YH-ame6]
MANRGLLVITHGKFGIEIVKSAEMIMGPQDDVHALALRPGDSVDDLRAQAFQVIEDNAQKGLETIVLCDLLGGSPSNVALSCMSKGDIRIFTGVNLPMLIEMLQWYKTEEDLEVLLGNVKKTAEEGIRIIDRNFLKNR